MPKAYEEMKKRFIKQGMSAKAAATKAAKIYNSRRGGKAPVTRGKHK